MEESYIAGRDELAPSESRLSLLYVLEAEAAHGAPLPFDVLILATLSIPLLVHACGLQRSRLGDPNWDCAGPIPVPAGWVPIATFGGEQAMRESTRLDIVGSDNALAIGKRAPRDLDPHVRIVTFEGADPPVLLSTFLEAQIARRWGKTVRWNDAVSAARADPRPLDPSMEVTLVDDGPQSKPAQRVSHAKFGEGIVVAELEGDKLEIAFDSGEKKRLARSFVRLVSE